MDAYRVFLLIFIFCFSISSKAKIEVLFHPVDPTLEKIATWIFEAKHSVNIAMYNLDTSMNSPFINAVASPQIQSRVSSGDLHIRFIFEGYDTPVNNANKMAQLKSLGMDVRFLASSKAVHHKFAVLDSDLIEARVVSGSANWSLDSYRNYDENILFFDQEPFVTAAFTNEFELLWNHSIEFDFTKKNFVRAAPLDPPPADLQIFFNSAKHLLKDPTSEHNLPSQLVNQIQSAKKDLLIATTRARIISVLEALKAAALRGVKIKILLNQDDFHDLAKRAQWLLNEPNIELRIKFYNLRVSNYLAYQMHNKFMIIDHEKIFTGSFNWSDASQNDNIENVIVLSGSAANQVLPSYINRFEQLWNNGRLNLEELKEQLRVAKANHVLPPCSFNAISLMYPEILELLSLAPRCI